MSWVDVGSLSCESEVGLVNHYCYGLLDSMWLKRVEGYRKNASRNPWHSVRDTHTHTLGQEPGYEFFHNAAFSRVQGSR